MPEEGEPTWLRYITDNEDILPIKHKIDHVLNALPSSLTQALRAFLLARTIRNMRGQKVAHCSMLVNASRFTAVQGRLRNPLHEALERIQNSVRINASRGAAALSDPEIAALHGVWQEEYPETEFDWPSIQSELLDAIASAKIVKVNSRANDLDYSNSGERGQTVVAVGGFSLSRGLTLEGLTVTWFLRNTMMYDTLMQMGRWFGYRGAGEGPKRNYEDLCRIWMPTEAIDWYAFIANAAEELHEELRTMAKAKATPRMFGLAVRSHPASLLVTARNKMGSGKKVTTLVGLSNKFVETSRVSIRSDDLRSNSDTAKRLVQEVNSGGFEERTVSAGICVMGVPVEIVDRFLAGWRNAEQSIASDPGPIRQYIRSRRDDELPIWDVLITGKKSGDDVHTLGRSIRPITRSVDPMKLTEGFIPFGGKRMRVADASFEKAGLDDETISAVEEEYRSRPNISGNRPSYPGSIYRSARERPLLMLMLVKPLPIERTKGKREVELIPADPVVAWGISLPVSSRPAERVEYVVNTVRYQELFGEDDEDDDQEAALEAS
ncbi:MAG: Z1 domain-containing protein [Paracoccaceae bacterium]